MKGSVVTSLTEWGVYLKKWIPSAVRRFAARNDLSHIFIHTRTHTHTHREVVLHYPWGTSIPWMRDRVWSGSSRPRSRRAKSIALPPSRVGGRWWETASNCATRTLPHSRISRRAICTPCTRVFRRLRAPGYVDLRSRIRERSPPVSTLRLRFY